MEIMSNEIIDFENAIDDSIKDIENLDYIDNDTDNVEPETDDIEYDNDNDIDVSERE